MPVISEIKSARQSYGGMLYCFQSIYESGDKSMDKKTLYLEVYRMFDRIHPLRFDCGRLCDKVCCRGTDEEIGMYLFPGEELVHEKTDCLDISETNFTMNGKTVLIAACNGNCERGLRPLACRIFPLTPFITSKDILLIKMDPRARSLCPLTKDDNPFPVQPLFKSTVRRAFALLIQDPEIKAFVKEFSEMLAELERF